MRRRLKGQAVMLAVSALGVCCTALSLALASYAQALAPGGSALTFLDVMQLDGRTSVRVAPETSHVEVWLNNRGLTSMVEIEPYAVSESTIRAPSGTAQWITAHVRPSMLGVVGVSLVAGRNLAGDDPADSVVLISKAAADAEFGGATAAVGRLLTVNGVSATVVGVVASSMGFQIGLAETVDVVRRLDMAGRQRVQVLLRIRAAARRATLSEVQHAFDSVPRPDPGDEASHVRWVVGVLGGGPTVQRVTAFAALAAVVSVVVVTAINAVYVGAILIRRRRRECAVRWALGASVPVLVREELLRSATVALFATAGGGIIAAWGLRAARLAFPPTSIRAGFLEGRVEFVAAAGIVVFSVIAISSCGRLIMVSSNFARQLNGESRSDLGTPRLGSGGRAFLGVVSCVAVMLSATAFISARAVLSARRLPAVSLLNDVAVVEVRMPTWRFSSRESRAQLASEIDGAVVSAVNGDTRVGFASSTPPDVGVLAAAVSLEGMEIGRESHSALGAVSIAGRYFDALGIRALAGRFPAKGEKSAVVVSESVARMFGRRPSELVGRRLQVGPEFWAIVGVVADVVLPGMTSALGGRVVYFPLVAGRANVSLLVRPASSAQAVKVALSNIDPDLAVSAASLPDRIMTNVKPLISMAVGFVAAAIAAMTLAVAGAYAVCASFVEHNRREIGIRIALGARSRDMASWLIRLTFVYCFLGALAGGVLPFAVGRWWAQSEQVLGGAEPAVRLGAVLSVTVVLAIAALWPLVRYRRAEPADVLT